MDSSDALVVVDSGAVCSLGNDPVQIHVAWKAGCRRFFQDSRLPLPRDGRLPPVARYPVLEEGLDPWQRMVEMGRLAALQAIGQMQSRASASLWEQVRVAVPLSLPPTRPGLAAWMIERAAEQIAGSVHNAQAPLCASVQLGHDGFIALLPTAQRILESGDADLCLVGGVDSAVDLEYLAWLDGCDRLKSRQQPFGLMPGEGAAFCVLALRSRMASARLLPELQAFATENEPAPWFLGRPTQGKGLTCAIQKCLKRENVIDACFADLNGEVWRSSEWEFAYLRNGRQFRDPLDLHHPSDNWGDLGAATASMLTVLVCTEFKESLRGYRSALVCASADTRPTRSALLLTLPEPSAMGLPSQDSGSSQPSSGNGDAS